MTSITYIYTYVIIRNFEFHIEVADSELCGFFTSLVFFSPPISDKVDDLKYKMLNYDSIKTLPKHHVLLFIEI